MSRHCRILLFALAASACAKIYAAQFKLADQTFTVPDGFEVELVASTNLVLRPVSGSFDEQGRLYVTDSSGSNEKPAEQTNNPTHRVLRLEDTDGDGKFDKSVVFADKVMFPEGCLWYDGSVYVAAPPSIWKFTDTDGDGVADKREEWHQGKTLTGCANDLHGPYLGPDGWIYWCKGAFAEQTYEVNGKPFTSRAAHIFRARPDHTRLEPVITAGCDNPVGLTWTPEGELIMCGTFLEPGQPGRRDGMIHAVYGGVWGKQNDVLEGHKRTGDLLPVMTHMGPAAPCAVRRYESSVFGDEYRDNLFCCQFNLHKVSRHVLVPDGATFKTTDSDFLVSDSTDFHPTDVIEDADGSLLVLDTGAWYKLCCPTSQLAKPDVLGAIYRIRRKGAPKIDDPRGLKLAWGKMKADELVKLLDDERPNVIKQAMETLGKKGSDAVPALQGIVASGNMGKFTGDWFRDRDRWLKEQISQLPNKKSKRQNALWTLTRIETPEAREAVRTGIRDYEPEVSVVVCRSISLLRDREGASQLFTRKNWDMSGRLGSLCFEAAGRTGVWSTNRNFMMALTHAQQSSFERPMDRMDRMDRIEQHSLTYSLIESGAADVAEALGDFVALEQIDSRRLKPEKVISALGSNDLKPGGTFGEFVPYSSRQQQQAIWVASRHPEWGEALAGFFRERFTTKDLKDTDRAELEKQLVQFVGSEAIQKLITDALHSPSTTPVTRQMLMRAMARPGMNDAPKDWPDAVRAALDDKDEAMVRTAIATARALALVKANPPYFGERLQKIARDTARPDDLRLDALAALPRGLRSVEPDLMSFLCANLDPAKSVAMRSAAAGALAKAKLSDEQLLTLTDTLKTIGPMEVSRLLTAFEHKTNEAVGLRLVAALKESKGFSGVRPDALKMVATNYPPAVQQKAGELLALLNVDEAKQKAHLDELITSLPEGDIRRGQTVFNSSKAACTSCHKVGYLGGNVGPDLTKIGEVRTERDLLESIVYPSASFVRSYEPVIVATKSDEDYSGVLRKDAPDEVVLATGPNTEVRVARSDITEIRPGKVSVMPAGLDGQLSKQELADLIAFLKRTKWGPN